MANLKFGSTAYPLSVAILAVVISGCASGPLQPAEVNAYDGWWTAKIQKTTPKQFQNQWMLGCSNLEGEFSFEVVDGVVLMNVLGAEQEQLMQAGGKFTIKQETDFHVDEAAGSDVRIDDGQITYYIKGKLSGSNPTGTIQDFVQEIGAGCITKIIYVKE